MLENPHIFLVKTGSEFMREEWAEFEDMYPDIVEAIQREIPKRLHGRVH